MNAITTADEARSRLSRIVFGGCLSCSPGPNTMAEIQDVIEDSGVSVQDIVDDFCKERCGKGVLYIVNGRLRLRSDSFRDTSYCWVSVKMFENFIINRMKK